MMTKGPSKPQQQQQQQGSQPQLPTPEKISYYDQNNNLRPQLLDEDAEQWAKKLSSVRSSQLRRFYDTVLALDRQIQQEAEGGGPDKREAAFQRLRAQFKMLRSKAAYAQKRNNLPEDFLKFFVNHTSSVQTVRDFDAFRQHFEAVMGFHRFFAKER